MCPVRTSYTPVTVGANMVIYRWLLLADCGGLQKLLSLFDSIW